MNKALALTVVALTVLSSTGSVSMIARARSGLLPVQRRGVRARAALPPTEEIPKDFETYSLFLICNPKWLVEKKSKGLYGLYNQFDAFGRTIGDVHLAVWFLKSESRKTDHGIVGGTDVERSVHFCRAWKLKPSTGPHVVVTSTWPDESHLSSGLPKDSAVFELGNMSPEEISDLLAKLTDELIEKGHINAADPAKTPAALWVELLGAVQRTINNFGCAWSFKIEAAGVSANLRSCQGH